MSEMIGVSTSSSCLWTSSTGGIIPIQNYIETIGFSNSKGVAIEKLHVSIMLSDDDFKDVHNEAIDKVLKKKRKKHGE
ncbi:unnamed protein product [Lactuca virosa]|uniref:Uncharacterized protein n=1 Tax=Lactuca virosa TaxID=75947 RepID=A0AAU9L9N1_9ASTR|nr:unnamed protein product [Lactuca virosa]